MFQVYLEAKVVYNFVAAINTLIKHSIDTDGEAEDRLFILFMHTKNPISIRSYIYKYLKRKCCITFKCNVLTGSVICQTNTLQID